MRESSVGIPYFGRCSRQSGANEDKVWLFRLSLVNVKKDQIVQLSRKAFSSTIDCKTDEFPCPVTIKLSINDFSQIKNSMELQVYEKKDDNLGPRGGATTIANLRLHVAPILSFITEDQTRFSGQNLVFEKILIGSRPVEISCAEARDCFIPSPGFKPKEGYLYFVANGERLAFMLITDKGLQVVAPHKPKPPEARAEGTPPPTPVQQIQNQTFQLQINPDTRLKSFKQD